MMQHVACRALVACLALATVFITTSHIQADDGAKSKPAKKQPSAFVFYKLLETADGGGNEPFTDGIAYWYGRGSFVGSRTIYDLKVTLPFNKKFPGFGKDGLPAPMNINPTEMTYEISRNGKLVYTTTFAGWANLVDMTFFLHNGTVTPVEGWDNAYPTNACPTAPPSGFSFTHTYSNANVRMYGLIKSIWSGAPNACNPLGPKGPKLVCGIIVIP